MHCCRPTTAVGLALISLEYHSGTSRGPDFRPALKVLNRKSMKNVSTFVPTIQYNVVLILLTCVRNYCHIVTISSACFHANLWICLTQIWMYMPRLLTTLMLECWSSLVSPSGKWHLECFQEHKCETKFKTCSWKHLLLTPVYCFSQ